MKKYERNVHESIAKSFFSKIISKGIFFLWVAYKGSFSL